jgi:transcriptional regulator with XRE-family HTH domain
VTARPNKQQVRDGLGKRLTKFRNTLGLSQQEAAAKFGVGRTTWIRYETKNREPKPAILSVLAQHGLNVAWLLNGDDAGPMVLEGNRRERHADLVGSLIGEPGAVYRYESHAEKVNKGLRDVEEMFDNATDAVGFRPSALVSEGIKQAMIFHGLDLDGAKVLLRFLKIDQLER